MTSDQPDAATINYARVGFTSLIPVGLALLALAIAFTLDTPNPVGGYQAVAQSRIGRGFLLVLGVGAAVHSARILWSMKQRSVVRVDGPMVTLWAPGRYRRISVADIVAVSDLHSGQRGVLSGSAFTIQTTSVTWTVRSEWCRGPIAKVRDELRATVARAGVEAPYRARFFFDWGSGLCLWGGDHRTRATFGSAIDHHELGLPGDLVSELDRLIAWHDTALNWEYPPDPGPWREAECLAHNRAVQAVFAQLRTTLQAEWDLVDEYTALHEDPDLDRYMEDPTSFRR